MKRENRIETLDLLRLLAAFSVVAYHYTFRGAAADDMTWLSLPALTPVTKYCYLGVQLFFVISGFVIAYSAEGRTAKQFVVARAARIYPGFIACMTLTFVATIAIGAPRFTATGGQWLANLLIFSPALKQPFMDGAYWSIVYEIIFYGWVLVLIATGLFARRLPIVLAIWLALSLVNEMFLHSVPLRRLFLTDDSGFFAAGIALYLLFTGNRTFATFLLLAVATIVGAKEATIGAEWQRTHFGIPFSDAVIVAISFATVALVALSLIPRRLPLPAALVFALGGLTYPLYLLHQHLGFMIFNRLEGAAAPPAAIAAGTLLAILALSYLIFRFVERPGQRLLKATLPQILVWPPRLPSRSRATPTSTTRPAGAEAP
ncbi:MAG: acyltransferase [Bauldia sp.]